MSNISALTVFIIVWWMIFLMALPFGSSPPETIEKGHANSAPSNPMLKKKLVWTTVITIILWLIIIYFIQHSGYSFYD